MAYLPLSTANLPDPVINPAQGASPEDHFGTLLWTGDGTSNQSVTGLNFQPDLVFSKGRNIAFGGVMLDAVRGSDAALFTPFTNAETTTDTNWNTLTFQSGGFNTGSGVGFNNNTSTFVSWNWKANGSGVSNTDGNVTSTVSANTTSGFSVVTWTGDESVSDQVGHGLNQKPDVIIARRRDAAHDWLVWGEAIGTAYNSRIFLNRTDAIGTTGSVGASTDAYFAYDVGGGESWLAYCFHSVDGFSKFGSYVGNGSADGPFIYTGFRPKFIISKRTDSSGDWHMYDAERDTYNVVYKAIWANYSSAEYLAYNNVWDFLSNGFKARTSSVITNASGATYIYMAFAENPFKYSNAR